MHLVYKALEKYAIPSILPPELMPPGKRKDVPPLIADTPIPSMTAAPPIPPLPNVAAIPNLVSLQTVSVNIIIIYVNLFELLNKRIIIYLFMYFIAYTNSTATAAATTAIVSAMGCYVRRSSCSR